MALSFVGGDASFATGAVTLNLPGGIAQNDVVIAAWHAGGAIGDQVMALGSADYSTLADLFRDDNVDSNLGVFRKLMGATPDSTVVSGNLGGVEALAFHCWSGCDTGTPEDATTTTDGAVSNGTPNPPSIDTATANAIVWAVGGSSEADAVTNTPSGYSNLFDAQGTSTNVMISSKLVASPGTENPGTYADVVGTTADSWTAATGAIRPAAEAASGTSVLTLKPIVLASTGVMQPSGTSALTLKIISLSASGIMQPSGISALALNNAVITASGGETITGASALALNNAELASTGVMQPSGASVITLNNAELAASGAQSIPGTSALTLNNAEIAASGTHSADENATGISVITLASAVLASTGIMQPSGTSAITLNNAELAASGTHTPLSGVSAITLNNAELASAGAETIPGISALTLRAAVLSSSGAEIISGTSALGLAKMALASQGTVISVIGVSALDLAAIVLTSTGAELIIGSSALVLKKLQLAASGAMSGFSPLPEAGPANTFSPLANPRGRSGIATERSTSGVARPRGSTPPSTSRN